MTDSLRITLFIQAGVVLFGCAFCVQAQQAFLTELAAERDPARRSDLALTFADNSFDNARQFYDKGEVKRGDAELENMTSALKQCVGSLEVARKAKFYKKAELRVAYLQRRMQGLMDDLGLQERGWAEYTQRKLEEIHDKLIEGVMRK